jgi:hypothetical protein
MSDESALQPKCGSSEPGYPLPTSPALPTRERVESFDIRLGLLSSTF